uniref:Uncharacterized protein n=1 Tax=Anguilla anguilla TaxID=7936 RepID=A0A0E9S7V8_ANGAN
MLPAQMHSANSKVWERRNNGLGPIFLVWARSLGFTELDLTALPLPH